MHRKGLIKSFSKMLISYLWVAKIAILPVTLLYPFFKASCLKNSTTPKKKKKKFYNSFKMQSKWNIFPVGSHFSSLWTPKNLCFSFFFIYSYVLSYIHNFLYINLLHALSAACDTTDHSYLLRPLSSPGLPQKYSLLFFLVLKWEILSLPD